MEVVQVAGADCGVSCMKIETVLICADFGRSEYEYPGGNIIALSYEGRPLYQVSINDMACRNNSTGHPMIYAQTSGAFWVWPTPSVYGNFRAWIERGITAAPQFVLTELVKRIQARTVRR